MKQRREFLDAASALRAQLPPQFASAELCWVFRGELGLAGGGFTVAETATQVSRNELVEAAMVWGLEHFGVEFHLIGTEPGRIFCTVRVPRSQEESGDWFVPLKGWKVSVPKVLRPCVGVPKVVASPEASAAYTLLEDLAPHSLVELRGLVAR